MKSAEENNAENFLVFGSKEIARGYIDNWERLNEHAVNHSG